jgi:hypothetical protein
MVALIVGIVFLAFTVFSVLSGGLNWWNEVLFVLKGAVPILALLIGLIAIFIGVADIKDKIEAKKEEEEEAKEESKDKPEETKKE